jgi:hypothetical protein
MPVPQLVALCIIIDGTLVGKVLSRSGNSAIDVQPTEEPQSKNDDQHQAESTADPRAAIPTVPVIAAAPAEQQDDQDNDQDCAHSPISFRPWPERLIDTATLNGRLMAVRTQNVEIA